MQNSRTVAAALVPGGQGDAAIYGNDGGVGVTMTKKIPPKNLAASVRERLAQRARSKGQEFNWLLTEVSGFILVPKSLKLAAFKAHN